MPRQRALAVDRTLPQLWFNPANLLHAREWPAEAEQAFRWAPAIDAGLYAAHFNLAWLLLQQDRLDEVAAHSLGKSGLIKKKSLPS